VNLRYRAREYDVAVRYHKDMNFTMIRNWVGQTGDDEFFDACDKYGIVVWEDFWLANPADGPIPDDNTMFLANSSDFIQRIRNHRRSGCIAGATKAIRRSRFNEGLKSQVAALHPGMRYIPSSSMGTVERRRTVPQRAAQAVFPDAATTKLHSELGMPKHRDPGQPEADDAAGSHVAAGATCGAFTTSR